ncbi:MAG: TonB-dependent receptor family protein [Cellvibrionaceae bacterium]
MRNFALITVISSATAITSLLLSTMTMAQPQQSSTTDNSVASTVINKRTDRMIEEVITVGRRLENQFDVIGNVAKLNEDDLKKIKSQHIQDALVRVPGVSLHQGNGQEYLPAIRSPVLTGAGACGAFLIAQDSIPLRAAGFCNVNELFEAYTETAKSIEVIRGPSNSLYGSNAVHGVINVLLPHVPEQASGYAGIELGANDYRREEVGYGTTFGEHGFVANLTTTHDGGYRDDAYYDQQKLQLRHETELKGWDLATTFTASNLNQETAGFVVGSDIYLDGSEAKKNLNPEAYRDVRSFRLYSQMEKKVDESNSIMVTPYLRKTEMDFLQHFLPGDPLEENGQKSLGVMFAWYGNGFAGEMKNLNWVAGVDFENTEGYLKQSQDAPTQGSAFLVATIPNGQHYDYDVHAIQLAPYVHADFKLSSRLSMNGGIRIEGMYYDYDNKMLTGRTRDDGTDCGFGGCRYSRPSDRDDDFTNWSAQIGWLVTLTQDMNIFANVAKGFRAPQATELYRLQNAQVVADLDSEEILSLEVGLRGQSSQWNYELNLYRMEKENVIFQDSSRINLSDGATEHLGAELSVGYQFTEAWDFALVANYGDHTYSNAQFSGGINIKNNQVDTAPKHFGAAHLGLQLSENMRAELEFVHMGSYYTDPENLHRYDGHDVLNLRTQWKVCSDIDVSIRVLNLLDERYAERADFSGFAGDRYFPGEPRSVYAALEYRF